jgi:hypothetical protein
MVAEIADIRWGREETDKRTLTSVKSVHCIMSLSRTGSRILLFPRGGKKAHIKKHPVKLTFYDARASCEVSKMSRLLNIALEIACPL